MTDTPADPREDWPVPNVWNERFRTAPFDTDGSLLEYAYPWKKDIIWRLVMEPMDMTLNYERVSQRREGVLVFYFRDEQGASWPMRSKEMWEILGSIGYVKNVHGIWEVVKRGPIFGVRLVKEIRHLKWRWHV